MTDVDEKDRSRERSRRERPSRFSEGSRDRDRSTDRGGKDRGTKSSNCRVYVSNIPYEYRWQDLKDLFRSQVGDVSFVELFVDENDKPRGCGIVEFSDPQSVKKCLEVMHRFELKGRKIVIKEDFGNSRDKYGNLIGKRNRDRDDSRDHRYRDDRRGGFDGPGSQMSRLGQDSSESKWGNTYGLSPQFLESLGINTPLSNRVFVANLDYNVDKKKLKEVFRLAGKVQKVDLSYDKDGRSRGFAVVEFDHPVESVQAISMFHNQQLYDRIMTVRMDRASDTIKLPEGLKGIGMGLGSSGEPLKDVARNLPSNTMGSNQPSAPNTGAGILGAVPTSALPLGITNAAAALSGLNNVVGSSGLGSLNTTASVLQAANLAGVGGLSSSLLTSGISGTDLSLASGLVNNQLVQNQSLAALASSAAGANSNPSNSSFSRNDNTGSFSRDNSGFQSNSASLSQNQGFSSGARSFSNNYETQKPVTFGGFGSSDRDTRQNSYTTVNNGGQLQLQAGSGSGKFSNKILISNLPPTASYKMLSEKCNEFGDVQRVDDKGNGTLLVVYSSDWEAERAIKNMDRARIDGRTITVRYF